MFYDLDSRELRVRPNPLSHDKIIRLRGNRPATTQAVDRADPCPTPRASNTGVIMVCGQKVALGRTHQHQTFPWGVWTQEAGIGPGSTTPTGPIKASTRRGR